MKEILSGVSAKLQDLFYSLRLKNSAIFSKNFKIDILNTNIETGVRNQ